MARKKTSKPKPPPVPTSFKSVAFRVSEEYAAWVDGLAASNRTTIAGLMDQALAEFAQRKGYSQPPERI
jgi:hypothetical protein